MRHEMPVLENCLHVDLKPDGSLREGDAQTVQYTA